MTLQGAAVLVQQCQCTIERGAQCAVEHGAQCAVEHGAQFAVELGAQFAIELGAQFAIEHGAQFAVEHEEQFAIVLGAQRAFELGHGCWLLSVWLVMWQAWVLAYPSYFVGILSKFFTHTQLLSAIDVLFYRCAVGRTTASNAELCT